MSQSPSHRRGLAVAPATLTAFLAWFGLPATSTEPVSTPSGPPVTVMLGGLAGIALLAASRWPRRENGKV